MGLPNLINKFTNPEKEKKEFFLALEILEETVKGAIWTIEEGKSRILALGSDEIWEEGEEELTAAVDKSLTTATERLAEEGGEPSRVIFGLSEDWAPEGKILPEYQQLLQSLCRKLDLKPAGFVSIFDAIIHHLKEIEGTHISAILVSPGKKIVWLAVVDSGQIKGVEKVSRSENFAADVLEGLLRVDGVEIFPSRILLFDGGDMESLRQILIDYPWVKGEGEEKKLPFLHLPKVEILPQDFDIAAVSIAGGEELAQSLGFEVTAEKEKRGEIQETQETGEETKEKEEEIPQETDLGFVRGRDVAEMISPQPSEEKKPVEPEVLEEELVPSNIELPVETKPAVKKGLRLTLPRIALSFPKIPLPRPRGFLVPAVIAGIILIGFSGLFLWLVWYFPRADVVIYASSQMLSKKTTLIVDPNQELPDQKNFVLPGQVLEVETSGEKNTATTGQKTVGEKAKGEAVIYNRTDAKKVFGDGTVIVGPGGLKFTLDREVTVASKTPDLVSGVDKWGESKVAVTADNIGAQYNLAAGSQFSFKDFSTSSYLAKNEAALSGGTSRQIPAVSAKDQENLLKTLTEELQKKARDDLKTKASQGQRLIEESASAKEVNANFDHKVGDEAQNLTLNLSVNIKGLAVKENELFSLAENYLGEAVPAGYELRKSDMDFKYDLKKRNDDGSVVFDVAISADLLPKVDKDQWAKVIQGKSVTQTKDFLRANIPGFQDAEIEFVPHLPAKLQFIPRNTDHLRIEIRSR